MAASIDFLQPSLRLPLLTPEEESALLSKVRRWQDIEAPRFSPEAYPAVAESLGVSTDRISGMLRNGKISRKRYHEIASKIIDDHALAKAHGIPVEKLRKIQRNGETAKAKLVERNLRMVVALAMRLPGDEDELIQDGVIGLNRAIEKFRAEKGRRLSTYSHLWIKQAMQRGRTSRTRGIAPKHYVMERFNKLRKIAEQFEKDHKRKPTNQDLSELCNLTVEQIAVARNFKRSHCLSLDASFCTEEEHGLSLGDAVAGIEDPWGFVIDQERREISDVLMHRLTDEDQGIIDDEIIDEKRPAAKSTQLLRRMGAHCEARGWNSGLLG